MPRHKKGTCVRLLTLEEQGEEQFTNNCTDDAIDEGGWIWIVQRFVPAESSYNDYALDAYECRSIATGVIMQLFPEEITTRPMKENHNDVTETDKRPLANQGGSGPHAGGVRHTACQAAHTGARAQPCLRGLR